MTYLAAPQQASQPALPATAPQALPPIDPRELRQVLGSFVTGVTIITTVDQDGKRWGLTANSFTSVSLNPPLVLWNQSVTAPSYPVFRDAQRFAVNILAEDQVDMSRRFASPVADKFAGVGVRSGLGGVPLIDGCAAYIECSREGAFPGGDHAVFLGRVERMEKWSRRPLVFGQGRYLMAQPHEYSEPSPDTPASMHAQLQAVRMATPLLVELSRELDRSMALSVWGSHGPTVIRWEQPARDALQAQLLAGQLCRLLTSATGLAWAAHLPASQTHEMIEAELKAPMNGTPASRAEADELLSQMRRQGLARVVASTDFTHRYSARINAAAAPVFDAEGRMVLALTLVGAAEATDVDWGGPLCQRLRSAAAQLSQRLGYQG
jgi:flavin reductase (DIM6/NTAB) family NADH-FMN oxidoreductase RutF/DNA-binding IclR family transcriptional regulator